MSKVEFLELDMGMSEEALVKKAKRLEMDGYKLTGQSGYTMFYESTDEEDKNDVIKKHEEYMQLLKSMGIDC
ncbi:MULTISPECIES: hypothetical protein [unclassified Lacrimispora]|uniref:hypothetical protein n=1 Tax=unclassified Lacrimispora TaxID=2719232 RepID=UPI00376FA4C4